jgi:predicted Fe-S protein YdhL (DUF1289 family)
MTAIQTPCISVCAIDPSTNRCAGCGRSLEEIARWTSMSATERQRIMDELPARRVQADVAVRA